MSIDPGARRDWGFFGGGDPGEGGDGPDGSSAECEHAGHMYAPAGGGLEVCGNCGSEHWADEIDEATEKPK